MTTSLRRWLWIAGWVALVGLVSWRLTLDAGQPSQNRAAVQIVPAGQAVGGDPGTKGATYYAIEGQTTRLTMRFVDGTRAVAERGVDGTQVTRLEDALGNEINRVRLNRVDGVNDVVQYSPFGSAPVLAKVDPMVRQTLDWSSHQSHRLYQDRVRSSTPLVWKGGMMRAADRAPSSARDNDSDVREIEARWANGLAASTRRRTAHGETIEGQAAYGDVLVTRLTRDGIEVGQTNYLVENRVFVWNMPGLSEGTITAAGLKRLYGGWPFTPDTVWMNLQAIATYHFRTLLKEKGTVARQRQPPRHPILQFFVPTLAANDEGCDSLHWVDGTIYRPCCDVHDQCYDNNGCSSKTWWQWGSWKCDVCNVAVISCFVATTVGHIRYPYGG